MGYNIYILDQTQWRVWFAGQTLNSDTIKRVKDWGIENGAELCFNLGIFKMIYENGKLVKGNGLTYVHTPTGDLGYGVKSNTLHLQL